MLKNFSQCDKNLLKNKVPIELTVIIPLWHESSQAAALRGILYLCKWWFRQRQRRIR